jgi:hypothetical protein
MDDEDVDAEVDEIETDTDAAPSPVLMLDADWQAVGASVEIGCHSSQMRRHAEMHSYYAFMQWDGKR